MRYRVAVLLVCGVIVYLNAMPAPFILDDTTAILRNQTIRSLWPPSVPLSPPPDTPVTRRPIVNVTLAANYALGGLDPRGYRAANLAIHLLVALVLFGIVRRTLRLPGLAPVFASTPDAIAFIAALLWILHPLNSEVVDYVTERSESLMALAYLLTMYCATRALAVPSDMPDRRARRRAHVSAAARRDTRWEIGAIACCAAGMLCKESMVTAPVAVVLYDRVFRFESLAAAWRNRARLYAGLAASWLVLAAALRSGQRSSAGFGTGVSPATYLLNQIRLVPHYVSLAVWPRALVVDYGLPETLSVHAVMLPAIVLAAVVIASAYLFVRVPRLGFGVAFFFLTLAPTSSFVPIATEVGAERRMYLPLAGLIAAGVCAAYLLLRRMDWRGRAAIAAAVCLLAALGTYVRNGEYLDPLVLTRSTVERWPSGRAHLAYATQLIAAGRRDEGIAEFRRSAAEYAGGHYALGSELVGAGRVDEGLAELREFIRVAPSNAAVAPARDLIGRVLMTRGDLDAAAAEFSTILSRDPRNVRALVFLGDIRQRQGRTTEEIDAYERARAVDHSVGGDGSVLGRLAIALTAVHRLNDAVAVAQDAVIEHPDSAVLQKVMGQLLAMSGRVAESVPHFRRAVELAPRDEEARAFLAVAERQAGDRR